MMEGRRGERGDELQPAKPRPAGSGGAAPRHRDAFVRVIILTLTLRWWSCLLLGRPGPFMAGGWGGGRALRRRSGGPLRRWCRLGSAQVSGGPGSSWARWAPDAGGNSIGLMIRAGQDAVSSSLTLVFSRKGGEEQTDDAATSAQTTLVWTGGRTGLSFSARLPAGPPFPSDLY